MRLLNATSLEFEVFQDDQIPPYVILSHTWGTEEVSYQEKRFLQQFQALPDGLKKNEALNAAIEAAAGLRISLSGSEAVRSCTGYKKMEMTAMVTRKQERDYFWIDTCCIDKSSGAELQEAINSMYQWFQRSDFCVVYLEDAQLQDTSNWAQDTFHVALQACRWVTRGWTLQELIVPSSVTFYDREWTYICAKTTVNYMSTISQVTGIPEEVLGSGDTSRASVAQKISWSAARRTTRVDRVVNNQVLQVWNSCLT